MRALCGRASLCICLATLATQARCSCGESAKPDPCPSSFMVGEHCPTEDLICPWPESKCKPLPCTCERVSGGGLYWACQPANLCTCTCTCGYSARVSCESLDCNAKPDDPCPTALSDVCALVCQPPDGGYGDAALDARSDARRDARGEARPDGPQDTRPDSPADSGPSGEGRSE